MSTRAPGYVFSNQVPPTSAFFSTTVQGMPACFSRRAAMMPDIPAPMTITRSDRRASISSMRQRGARASPSAKANSSCSSGRYASFTGSPMRKSIMRRRPAGDGAAATTDRASRHATSAHSARSRAAARAASGSSPCRSKVEAGAGLRSSRSSDRSPVICASAGSSERRWAPSSAWRMGSSSGGSGSIAP